MATQPNVLLVRKTRNSKLGRNFAVTYTAQSSCPSTCEVECYAKTGLYTWLAWIRCDDISNKNTMTWDESIRAVRALPKAARVPRLAAAALDAARGRRGREVP